MGENNDFMQVLLHFWCNWNVLGVTWIHMSYELNLKWMTEGVTDCLVSRAWEREEVGSLWVVGLSPMLRIEITFKKDLKWKTENLTATDSNLAFCEWYFKENPYLSDNLHSHLFRIGAHDINIYTFQVEFKSIFSAGQKRVLMLKLSWNVEPCLFSPLKLFSAYLLTCIFSRTWIVFSTQDI